MELFGIPLLGVNAETGHKLFLSLAVIVIALVGRLVLGLLARATLKSHAPRGWFWTRQAISLLVLVFVAVGLLSVWFDSTRSLAGFIGLFTAGIAFALQRVITSAAGYVLILRGKTFELGDRIDMGDVRGDVISLGFLQTTIMEMGQTRPEEGDSASMWENNRQFTGRVVSVANSVVFDKPIYNYTRDFPYVWEELILMLPYGTDRGKAEREMLDVARRHVGAVVPRAQAALRRMQDRYFVRDEQLDPRVYYRLKANALELSLRFLCGYDTNREVKDAMSRELLDRFREQDVRIGTGA
ncbi:MAG TPA: mechanosensitive ion channel domain-containing protein [Casimicrobiaceae bacterium]|jgi:small-conductance mechanosensitive channel|nr:mechanosensitive ion channel domain-containing protein [Casimicrobiaceae bacterium]